MLLSWLLAALLLALIELKGLVLAADAVGGLLFAWILLSALLGVRLLRLGGKRVLARGGWGAATRDLLHDTGRVPPRLTGLFLVASGLLLLLPGLFGDALGLLLLLPWFQALLLRRCKSWLGRRFGVVRVEVAHGGPIPARDQVVEVRPQGR